LELPSFLNRNDARTYGINAPNMADAVTKLLIAKGVISEAEFEEKLFKE
jgi:hypothetical protein